MTKKEEILVKLVCESTTQIIESQHKGDSKDVIAARVAGLIRGAVICEVITQNEGRAIIKSLKESFNF